MTRVCALAAALCIGLAASAFGQAGAPSVVRVEKTAQGYRLVRNGQSYVIKGAGGDSYTELLAEAGGNSVRTWGADDLEPLLDKAQTLGVTVTVGIWLGQPRQGFRYSDEAAVARQLETARAFVRRYRSHPALLMWGIGNEMEGDGKDPAIWKAVNEIARMAKQEDPNHPTMTVVAEVGSDKAAQFAKLCPDVDILGINSYAGLPSLPRRLKEQGFDRPYVITEFGPPGPWEVGKTAWGAPMEPTSAAKAESYLANYRDCISGQAGKCLGSYVFLWGHKQEATATWFGMLLKTGERLPTMDAMTYAWTGKWPANRCPQLDRIETEAAEKEVAPGAPLTAKAVVTDPEGDPLIVRWEVRHESTDRRTGGDIEREPLPVPGCQAKANSMSLDWRAPKEPGAYRLFAFVYDGRGNAATANVPFYVKK